MEKGKITAIETAALNAWPATRQMIYDGWLLRMTGGESKRVNSVNVRGSSNLPLEAKFHTCEGLYAVHGLPVIFRLPEPFSSQTLSHELLSRGYLEFDTTHVLGREINERGVLPEEVEVRRMAKEDWLQVRSWVTGTPLVRLIYHAAVLDVIVPENVLMGLFVGEEPVACGMGVVEGNLLGYFSIYTIKGMRRKGYGRAVMTALTGWGREKGASFGYLQVEGDNAPALRMYEMLGFEEVYRYSYWKK